MACSSSRLASIQFKKSCISSLGKEQGERAESKRKASEMLMLCWYKQPGLTLEYNPWHSLLERVRKTRMHLFLIFLKGYPKAERDRHTPCPAIKQGRWANGYQSVSFRNVKWCTRICSTELTVVMPRRLASRWSDQDIGRHCHNIELGKMQQTNAQTV